jgi:hypothetical protein
VARVRYLANLIRAGANPLHSKMLDALRAVGFRLVAVDLRSVESGAFTVPLLNLIMIDKF